MVVLNNSGIGADDIGLHILNPAAPLVAQLAAIAMSRDSIDQYIGRFQLAPTFILTLTRDGDALMAQATGQPSFRMWPSAPNEFFLREVDAQVTFVRDSTGRVASLVLHQNGANAPAPRLP